MPESDVGPVCSAYGSSSFSVLIYCNSVKLNNVSLSLINKRIEYKLLSLTYKVLATTQPLYLHNLISV